MFSGIGGFPLALNKVKSIAGRPIKTVGYCEIDETCRSILQNAMDAGRIQTTVISNDINTLDLLKHTVDILTAGFPCQGTSSLGKGDGLTNPQTKLLERLLVIIKHSLPGIIILENAPGITYKDEVMLLLTAKLSRAGYATSYIKLSAAELGAAHKRERWFALAVQPEFIGTNLISSFADDKYSFTGEICDRVIAPDLKGDRLSAHKSLRTLGNCIVPDQATAAIMALWSGLSLPMSGVIEMRSIQHHMPIIDLAEEKRVKKRKKEAKETAKEEGKKFEWDVEAPSKGGYIAPNSRIIRPIITDNLHLQSGFRRVSLRFCWER
jgi:DNA (cytosine-5)-methyltransferase 1